MATDISRRRIFPNGQTKKIIIPRTVSETGTSQLRYGRVSGGLGGYKCHLFSPEGDSDEAMEG